MRIEINEPQAIFETGQQGQQLNSTFPRKGEADRADRLFIIADGHEGGEMTPEQFVKNISGYFKRYRSASGEITDEDIFNALATCNLPDGKQPTGISFAMLCIHVDGITALSAGNCHILQVRPSKKQIVYENVGSEKASIANPAIFHIEDIDIGDYFVLFTKGMTEKMDAKAIASYFFEPGSDDKKRNVLRSETADNKGNHTLYFFKIDAIISDDGRLSGSHHNIVIPEFKSSVKPMSQEDDEDDDEEVVKPTAQEPEPVRTQPQRTTKQVKHQPRPISQYDDERRSTNMRMIFLVVIIVVLAIAAGLLWYFNSSQPSTALPADSIEVQSQTQSDTTAATAEPADSAIIPDTAIAEPERVIQNVSPRKRKQVPTYNDVESEEIEEPTETEEISEPAAEPATEHKTEPAASSSTSEPAKPAKPATSTTTE